MKSKSLLFLGAMLLAQVQPAKADTNENMGLLLLLTGVVAGGAIGDKINQMPAYGASGWQADLAKGCAAIAVSSGLNWYRGKTEDIAIDAGKLGILTAVKLVLGNDTVAETLQPIPVVGGLFTDRIVAGKERPGFGFAARLIIPYMMITKALGLN